MDGKEFLVEKYRYKRNNIHFLWSIGVLIFILILILSYKFWGKSGNLENLISIGSGLVSMSLALVAIFITLSEGIKTSNKEARLDVTLNNITLNTEKTEDILNKIQSKVDHIVLKTDTYLANMSKAYEVETANNNASNIEAVKIVPHTDTSNLNEEKIVTSITGEVIATSNLTSDAIVRNTTKEKKSSLKQERIFKGKVYHADLGPVIGSELGRTRPVIIVSNEVVNKFSPFVTIVPVTSKTNKTKLPTHISLGYSLNQNIESFALVEHIRTVDRCRLSELVATLDENMITQIDHAIDIQMGIEHS